jgi:hypothetical protein
MQWPQRDLTGKRDVSFWVDGVYFATRREEAWHCMLVLIRGCPRPQRTRRALGWLPRARARLARDPVDPHSRGRAQAPAGAIGDGALGFWKALRHVYGQTRGQRGGVQKTAHSLDKLPKDL